MSSPDASRPDGEGQRMGMLCSRRRTEPGPTAVILRLVLVVMDQSPFGRQHRPGEWGCRPPLLSLPCAHDRPAAHRPQQQLAFSPQEMPLLANAEEIDYVVTAVSPIISLGATQESASCLPRPIEFAFDALVLSQCVCFNRPARLAERFINTKCRSSAPQRRGLPFACV